MNNISIPPLKTAVIHFLHRFHLVLFVVVVIGSLAYAILSVSSVLEQSAKDDLSQTPSSQFDATTIDRINQLKTSDEDSSMTLPDGRTNPFVE